VAWRAKCYECGQEAPIAIPVFSTLALFAEDSSKVNHRRDGYWKKVTATVTKSDCDDRTVRQARAEYYELSGKGVGARVPKWDLTRATRGIARLLLKLPHAIARFDLVEVPNKLTVFAEPPTLRHGRSIAQRRETTRSEA
jgi:hypothetical protein